MYRSLPAALVIGSLFVASLSAQTASPEELLRHAAELQQAGDLAGAVDGYRAFLAVQPNVVAVRSNLGVLLAHMGRYDEAIQEYEKARELDPGNAGIVLNLGLAYYKSGRIEEAARTFGRARELAPENLQATLLLADCHLRLGQNRDVVALLRPLEAQQTPDDLAIAYMLGMALIRDGQVQEGQKRVDKILRNGDSAEARFLLGNQMFAAGDFPAAVKQFAGAIELNPSLPGLQASYGQALLNTGDPDAASEAFQKELAIDPNNFEANFYLAQIFIARRRWTDAEPLAQQAVRVRPDSLEAKLEMADLQLAERKFSDARGELELAEKQWPEAWPVHERLAQIYADLHLTADASRERKATEHFRPKQAESVHDVGAGDPAPEFKATRMGSEQATTLSRLRHDGPVLLVFGSYTCPNFRAAAETLNRLYPEYRSRIPFYLVYIREAHSTTDWASTRNQRENIVMPQAANLSQRQDHATMCVRKLHIEFPALLDSMNGTAEKAYSAWPSKAFLVDRHGRIVFSTGLSEQDFHSEQLEAALRRASVSTAAQVPVPSHRPQ